MDNASDTLTLPHSFSAGETISSSKMNENFEAVKQVIDSRKPFKVFSNGTVIGEFLNIHVINQDISVINNNGFIFNLDFWGNMKEIWEFGGDVYFETNDCSGKAYVTWLHFTKVIIKLERTMKYYYFDNDTTQENINYNSRKRSQCDQVQGVLELYQIKENDEAVTGVKTSFDSPITIKR